MQIIILYFIKSIPSQATKQKKQTKNTFSVSLPDFSSAVYQQKIIGECSSVSKVDRQVMFFICCAKSAYKKEKKTIRSVLMLFGSASLFEKAQLARTIEQTQQQTWKASFMEHFLQHIAKT